ncbi:uncharacterized protein BDZ99DRAFT_462367 [Mytilinidion resinicola]|uniref:Uncharacterized protein n=1 Tax=Mytilinidion resinicola TaxID=574789 RepID=A0A6A6YT47_9PEZI|nr:uncharacterized protein BDZ99DRAFT_462367 [Mytilinidion resinicola]KAF2811087.1 hypothetical protein BDZ99DRAFT_462367 [Mytilinidion resinicola]
MPTWSCLDTYGHGTLFVGTFHGSDVPNLFEITQGEPQNSTQSYYISVVYTMNPNVDTNVSLPRWPQWAQWGENEELLQFGAEENEVVTDTFGQESFEVIQEKLTELRL